ncbi:hypothetical protein DFAR_1470021 [Desulfarculales bacterium]
MSFGTDGQVLGFAEKEGQPGSGLINAGTYALDRRVIADLPAGRLLSLEREVFTAWIGRGLWGLVGPGLFLDIGTTESYARAEGLFHGFERL